MSTGWVNDGMQVLSHRVKQAKQCSQVHSRMLRILRRDVVGRLPFRTSRHCFISSSSSSRETGSTTDQLPPSRGPLVGIRVRMASQANLKLTICHALLRRWQIECVSSTASSACRASIHRVHICAPCPCNRDRSSTWVRLSPEIFAERCWRTSAPMS